MLRFRLFALKPKDISAFEEIILARNGKHLNTRSYQSASSSSTVESPSSQWFGKPSSSNESQRILDSSEMQRLLADEISDALDDTVDLETHESISNSIHHRDSEFEGNIWNLTMPKSASQKMTLESLIPNDYRFDPDLHSETKADLDSNPEVAAESSLHSQFIKVPESFAFFHDKVYDRFQPLADNQRTTIVSRDFLDSLLNDKDLNGIRKELSENLWPLIAFASKQIHQIFYRFIAFSETAEDIDEILALLSDL
uniref:Uncharacterized protein n=1 Tax=Panagrolaimus sp. ES5 TaxID=591445 RepID=A0AC34F6Y9_9BILA